MLALPSRHLVLPILFHHVEAVVTLAIVHLHESVPALASTAVDTPLLGTTQGYLGIGEPRLFDEVTLADAIVASIGCVVVHQPFLDYIAALAQGNC